MITFKEAFAKHINNEYPPEYVFYTTPSGDVGFIWADEFETVESTHDCVGMTDDSITHSHLIAAGNLPIIELKAAA